MSNESLSHADIVRLLGDRAEELLDFSDPVISKDRLQLPGPDFVQRIFEQSDRSPAVQESLERLFNSGRLAGSGYLSILPVDQGIEHTAAKSFYPNPDYFDPANILKLAVEGGCNAVASTYGVLSMMAEKYADEIPLIMKVNHNELLTYPNKYDQVVFSDVERAAKLGAAGIGATIYFGSPESNRQIIEISEQFERAHELGMFTILWCYPRNEAFTVDGENYERSDDITSQAIHLGATIGADIVKQKQPENSRGFANVDFAKYDDDMYEALTSDHIIDMTRLQVLHGYAGRVGLINSGGASGDNDLEAVVTTAVINKRAGGIGLITGRKAFQRPVAEGVEILNAIQDVYLDDEITVA